MSPMATVCGDCGGDLRLERETFDATDRVFVGALTCPACGRRYLDQRKPAQTRNGGSMGRTKKADRLQKGRRAARPKPKAARRTARQPALPGTEGVRSEKLDAICEGIGDERETMNTAKSEETKLVAAALEVMQKRGITVYRHARIELARVPGAEKLRVRVTKEEGDAGEEDLVHGDDEPADAADESTAAHAE